MLKVVELINEFDLEVGSGVSLVDFYADWCGPCKMIAPFIEKIDEEFKGTVNVFKVDVDKSETIAVRYNVKSIPTLLIFNEGTLVSTLVGFKPMLTIVNELKKYIKL